MGTKPHGERSHGPQEGEVAPATFKSRAYSGGGDDVGAVSAPCRNQFLRTCVQADEVKI